MDHRYCTVPQSSSTPKQEFDIAEAIDKWGEATRNLASIQDDNKLATPFLMVALAGIMNVGRANVFYEAQRMKCDDFSAPMPPPQSNTN